MMDEIDTLRSDSAKLAPQSDEAQIIGQRILSRRDEIEKFFSNATRSGFQWLNKGSGFVSQ